MRRMILIALLIIVALGYCSVRSRLARTRIHVGRDVGDFKATSSRTCYDPYFIRENYFPTISIPGMRNQ